MCVCMVVWLFGCLLYVWLYGCMVVCMVVRMYVFMVVCYGCMVVCMVVCYGCGSLAVSFLRARQ
jgi:hypothetical protein